MKRREFCRSVTSSVLLAGALSGAARGKEERGMEIEEKTGRPVRIVSLSFRDKPLEVVAARVDAEGARGADLIALPETWTGPTPLPSLDDPPVTTLAGLAR